jgi:hypothetical protein
MMPPIPAVIMLPTEIAHGYWPANVVAAIPLGHGSIYAVTAIDTSSSPDAPLFFTAEVGRSIHGFWHADETFPADTLADALGDMATLAGRVYPRLL